MSKSLPNSFQGDTTTSLGVDCGLEGNSKWQPMETTWEGVGPTQAVSIEVESATSTEKNDVIVNSAHHNVNPINTTNYGIPKAIKSDGKKTLQKAWRVGIYTP